MKRSHAGLWAGIAVFFAAAVYSILLFLLKPRLDPPAWVLYGATLLAFLVTGIQVLFSARTGSGMVMDTTLGIVTAVYFGLQLVFGGIVCMRFEGLPLIPVLVCEIILTAAYLVTAFLIFAAQSSNAVQDQNDQQTVQKMRRLENDVQGMAEEASRPEVRKALQKLAEEIHFSDVASLPGLADVESRIAREVMTLQEELNDPKADPLVRIETIRRLLKERDRTAAMLKR